MAKDETDSAPSETELSEYQTQFVPQENDEEDLWDVLEILEERGRKYKVRWAGIDPSTKKPWAPSWVPKHDCTDDLIHEWKKKKAAKKEEAEKRRKSKARSSIASSSKNKRSASTSTAATTRQTRRLTKETAPSTSTRPTSRADSPPQPSSSRVTLQDSKPHKRSRIAHDSPTEDATEDLPGLSRPRKKRKVEVEVVAGSSSSETDDEELLNPQFLQKLKATQSRWSPAQLTPTVRRLLAQEEEESTQEAEGLIPSSPPRPRPAPRPKSPNPKRLQAKTSILSDTRIHQASPSTEGRKLALQGRPSANDTFSREGIVPETQASAPSGSQEPRATNPSQLSAPLLAPAAPSTPPRAQSNRQVSHSGRGSSIKTKMKPKRSKELRPIPVVTPSVFRPHLPSADVEEIEEWSSPERDKQVAARLDILTQESIELAQFTQDQVESFVDWDGGVPPEVDPFVTDEDEPAFSLGPQLASPHADRRQAMQSVLDKRPSPAQRRRSEADISPEIPLMEELPPTSTTARAEVDSQSQQVVPDSQTQELSAMLEEKEQQLNQLELQIEDLQVQLKAAKTEKSEEAARFEAQLKSLQDGSDEKSEQISQLESQLVELQLQVTQVTSEQEQRRELHEAEVHELREALEERTEQISQLESALVELHTEISALAENEKLTQAQQQSADKHTEELAAAEQRAASLESELSEVRARLSKAEEEAATLSAQLESTNRDWERRYKYLEDDRDLFKNLYSEASTHASRLAAENATLEERARLAEGQATDGLALIRGTVEAQTRKLREEADKWRTLCEVLVAKDKATDDEVRLRAALEPELRAENARLRAEAQGGRRDMAGMGALVAGMKDARRRVEGEDADEEADCDADGDVDMGHASPSPSPPLSRKANSNGIWPGAASPSDSADRSGPPERILYVCQHVHGTEMCNSTFASPQSLIDHAWKTHYPGLEAYAE